MKQALVLLDSKLQEQKLDAHFVANVHDEWQIECRKEIAETVGTLAVEAIQEAGEVLQLRCPLTGEYRIGRTWAETH
jgi:DNA polymerase I-like protein with 3'-5' exonuclease and polymerase domains